MSNCQATIENRDGVEVFKLQDGSGAQAAIAPQLGNNCFAFSVAGAPVLEAISFEQFRARPTSYGIPLLFPFPNRIRDGAFDFRGATYKVDPPRHGFVRDKAWRAAAHGASDEEGAWLRSRFDAADYKKEILSQFPFPFTLETIYRLKDGVLTLEATAENTGDRQMPLGFGTHPYFQKPARGTLEIPAAQRWELVDSLPTGRLLAVEGDYDCRAPKDVEGLNFDDIFTKLTADENHTLRCYLNDTQARRQTVIEFPARDFPNVVVYTPPAPRQAICIEPNSCPTDAFNLDVRGIACNMRVLSPGNKIKFTTKFYTRQIE
jgi:aldose 1-epimerase